MGDEKKKEQKSCAFCFFFTKGFFIPLTAQFLLTQQPTDEDVLLVINMAKFKSKIKLVGAGHSSVKNPSPCFLDQLHGAKKIFFIIIDSTPIVFIPSFVAKYPRS